MTNYRSKVVEAKDRLEREKYAAILKAGDSTGKRAIEALAGLGNAEFSLKNYEQARDSFVRGVTLLEKQYGADSLEVARGLLSAGYAYHELKDYPNAEACYKRALDIQKAAQLPGHMPDAQDAARAYSRLLQDTGRAAEDTLPKTPYTLFTDLIRQYGEEGARKKMEEMMQERQKRKRF